MASLVNCLANQESNLKLSVVECGAGPVQSSKYISRMLSKMDYNGTYMFTILLGHKSSDYNSDLDFSIGYKNFVKQFSQYHFMKAIRVPYLIRLRNFYQITFAF